MVHGGIWLPPGWWQVATWDPLSYMLVICLAPCFFEDVFICLHQGTRGFAFNQERVFVDLSNCAALSISENENHFPKSVFISIVPAGFTSRGYHKSFWTFEICAANSSFHPLPLFSFVFLPFLLSFVCSCCSSTFCFCFHKSMLIATAYDFVSDLDCSHKISSPIG